MKKKISDEFKKYNWPFNYGIKKITGKTYEIVLPKCNIQFYINDMYSSVECLICINESKYSILEALMFNKKRTGYVLHNHSEADVFHYLKQYVQILNTDLLMYITEDFSWCKRVDKSLGLNAPATNGIIL